MHIQVTPTAIAVLIAPIPNHRPYPIIARGFELWGVWLLRLHGTSLLDLDPDTMLSPSDPLSSIFAHATAL